MHRSVLATIAALAMSACTYGSAIDIAPFEARANQPVLPPGDYCEMKLGASPKIISSEGCLRIEWDGARRIHTMIDLAASEAKDAGRAEGEDARDIAVVALGEGLYAAQYDEPDEPGRHELITFLAMGEVFSGVGMVEDATLRRLAAAHPELTWEDLPPERPAGEPSRLITSSPLIRSGTVEEIKAFLREASLASLRESRPDPDELPTVGVRDRAGAVDHPPSAAQLKAGQDLLKRIEALRK